MLVGARDERRFGGVGRGERWASLCDACRATASPSVRTQCSFQYPPNLKKRPPQLNVMAVFFFFEMVGAGRFELPTPTTPLWCATRLRYAPTEFVHTRRSRLGGNDNVPSAYLEKRILSDAES